MKKSRTEKSDSAAFPAVAAPKESAFGLPTAFFLVVAGLVYLGGLEVALHHGQFSARVYEPYDSLAGIPKVGGEVDPIEEGRTVYTTTGGCVACHQPNGSGNPANGCPPLAESDWVLAEGPGRLIRLVLHGSVGPITVNGQVLPGGNMTPFAETLDDNQIAHVLSFIRNEWGNKAPMVTPEMVKEVRDKTAGRKAQWTAAELEKIPVTE